MVAQHFLSAHPPSAQTLADLSGGGHHSGDIDPSTHDAALDSNDDSGSTDDFDTGDDMDFGDGGDLDLPDTFDV